MRKTLGAVLTAAVAASTALLAPAALAAPVTDRYIVTMKHRSAGVSAQSIGAGRVLRTFGRFPGFAAELTAAQAQRLAADPAVRHVERDRVVRLSATQRKPTWGLDRLDQRGRTLSKSYLPSADGDNVHAYVIDTGIRAGHQQFGGRASYGYDFVGNDRRADDCNGHGTHVAGTIGGSTYGVAKKVKLVAVRVLDCRGEGTLSDVIEGIDWVTAHAVHPAVANMSLGGGYSPALDFAVQEAIAVGITFVVAAGNENVPAALDSPAGVPEAITVAATDAKDRRAVFSNYGSAVDIFAPGVNIVSAVASSNTARGAYSGTSMAAPHVAGAAALLLDAAPGLTPAQVRAKLVGYSTKGRVTRRAGSPDRLLYVPPPPKAPAITTSRAGTATVLRPYEFRMGRTTTNRGTWQVAGGTLPPGLSLTSTGYLRGTPTQPGSYRLTVRFTDYVPQAATRTVVIPVQATAPVIATATLPAMTAGAAYQARLAVTDSRAGTWSLDSGVLPTGLTLSAAGVLSGVPTVEAGAAFTFTARFTDVWRGTVTRTFTLTSPEQPRTSAR
ncbi:S8 family peptidase [Actinoplanes sp. NPDC024001]|uniref:S8 family peptidase n=1 Tax=Actinoplanes sp. NPDC024001 TaxID=3154598 RepID=UPI0033D3E016